MREHHTKNKGDYGVLKVQLSLFEQGYSILTSMCEHDLFDLVAYRDGKFSRIQVKYRAASAGKIDVQLAGMWADRNGSHVVPYDKSEIDVLAVYCPDTDQVYYLSVADVTGTSVTIRTSVPKNNQLKGVRMASDFLTMPSS